MYPVCHTILLVIVIIITIKRKIARTESRKMLYRRKMLGFIVINLTGNKVTHRFHL